VFHKSWFYKFLKETGAASHPACAETALPCLISAGYCLRAALLCKAYRQT
jgi:hypothetical protein